MPPPHSRTTLRWAGRRAAALTLPYPIRASEHRSSSISSMSWKRVTMRWPSRRTGALKQQGAAEVMNLRRAARAPSSRPSNAAHAHNGHCLVRAVRAAAHGRLETPSFCQATLARSKEHTGRRWLWLCNY